MTNWEISRQLNRINDLVSKAGEASASNPELQSHWAKYICILAAGLLENALKDIYSEYAENQVSQPVAKFVSSRLNRISNPKTKLFLETSGAFKEEWRTELTDFVDQNGRREAIDSIMNQRHLIAHGKIHNSNISLVQIKDYLSKAVEVVEFIEQQCLR